MSDTPLKIGFVGSGGLAKHHMGQATRNGQAKIVAICDVKEEMAQPPAEKYESRVYTRHEEMIAKEELDAVYIAVPPFAHGEIELALCESKIPFFVEKPVAKEMETARKVESAVKAAGILTCVGYQLRYTSAAARLKQVLEGQSVGMGVGRYWCGFTQGQPRGWLVQRDLSGGQIIEQATHLLDMVRFLAGDITEVYGAQAKMLRGGGDDCPDVNAALLKLAGGGAVTITSSWGTGDQNDWSQANILQLFWNQCRADWSPDSLSITPPDCDPADVASAESRVIDDVFLNAVRTGDGSAILSDYSDAVKSLAVSVAIDESAASGQPVSI